MIRIEKKGKGLYSMHIMNRKYWIGIPSITSAAFMVAKFPHLEKLKENLPKILFND